MVKAEEKTEAWEGRWCGDYDREPRCIRGKEGRVSEKDDFVLLKTMLDKVTRCCRDRGVFRLV